ncbi:MAG: YraN family protein [Myxococcota bacterium]|nr:YraN family protein [Myxococcota bacterium]
MNERKSDARAGSRDLGLAAEERAAEYLRERGYRIVARNARADGVEIDIVAARQGLIVFVEVKARRSRRAGAPEEAVDFRKQRRLLRGAAAWLAAHRPRAPRVRFDVVACEPASGGDWRVRHWEGAFDAGD